MKLRRENRVAKADGQRDAVHMKILQVWALEKDQVEGGLGEKAVDNFQILELQAIDDKQIPKNLVPQVHAVEREVGAVELLDKIQFCVCCLNAFKAIAGESHAASLPKESRASDNVIPILADQATGPEVFSVKILQDPFM
jgi:hypothetical protein